MAMWGRKAYATPRPPPRPWSISASRSHGTLRSMLKGTGVGSDFRFVTTGHTRTQEQATHKSDRPATHSARMITSNQDTAVHDLPLDHPEYRPTLKDGKGRSRLRERLLYTLTHRRRAWLGQLPLPYLWRPQGSDEALIARLAACSSLGHR